MNACLATAYGTLVSDQEIATERMLFEVDKELELLNTLLPLVPTRPACAIDNHAAIVAQVRVIGERMTSEQVVIEFRDADEHLLSNAMDAYRWLYENDEPVSESWADLAEYWQEA